LRAGPFSSQMCPLSLFSHPLVFPALTIRASTLPVFFELPPLCYLALCPLSFNCLSFYHWIPAFLLRPYNEVLMQNEGGMCNKICTYRCRLVAMRSEI
jgi:hypothetical protein